jgi:thioredoxin 1|tara:strand:+ start:5 stop:367 length:363 start_codon:yes stop_codon:yes gene_type:complete
MDIVVGDECFKSLDLKEYIFFYFTASWCGPCQAIAPEIKKLSEELDPNIIRFFKIDIDEDDNNEICDTCKIKSVPSFLLFKDRTYLNRVSGADIDSIKKLLLDNIKVEESERKEDEISNK